MSSTDAGGAAKTDALSYAANYIIDMRSGNAVRFGYATEKQDKSASNTDDERTISTFGVKATMGDWLFSLVRLGDEKGDDDKSACTEIEVAYDLSDKTVLNLVHLDSKQNKGVNKGDKYKATQIWVNYEVAPGLLMGVAHTRFNATAVNGRKDSDGNATRFKVRLNF